MDHPFWNTQFLLEDPDDLAGLMSSQVRELWIDTAQGLDAQGARTEAEVVASTEELMHDTAVRDVRAPTHEALDVEIARAARICGRARSAVVSLFAEARMGRAITTAQLTPLVDEIASSVLRNPGVLISLARLKTKDDYTYMHSVAVCGLMISLGRQMGLPESDMREIGLAGMVHDLGKAEVPDEILNKPGKLTEQEFNTIKNHPAAGHRMLLEGQGVGTIPLDVCLHHHEKFDGSGYPEGLADKAISLYAKMGTVCDVYDAITSTRPYKAGWSPAEALSKMVEWSEGHFDRAIFQAFIKCLGIYPVGSLVRLESGLLAVVLETSNRSLLTPSVKTFYCTRRKERLHPKIIDLSRAGARDKITNWEAPGNWPFPDLDELWSGLQIRR